ncbi:MAG TPA: hypothetical protein VM370_01790, partial [Candidatus Thermoplasmatota archaeon]|nr:hypothetical protein [Candidatus Thermoplasmatota archaeon]
MTTRTRLLAVTMAALMLASSVVIFAPAAIAQDGVPTRPTVIFEPIPNLRQFLYPHFANIGGRPDSAGVQPDCPSAASTAAHALTLDPADGGGTLQARQPCTFTPGNSVEFTTAASGLNPNRRINFTGNNSFAYHHAGVVPDGVVLTVDLRSEGTTIASGRVVGANDDSGRPLDVYDVTLNLAGNGATTGRQFADANKPLILAISSAGPSPTIPLDAVSPSTWRLNDNASWLEVRGDDIVRAASWITDEKNVIRSLFTPIANDSLLPSDKDRRVVGHFALQSALGITDASRGAAPQFSILLDGHVRELGAGGVTVLTGVENTSASVTALGLVVWSFPASSVNYRGFPAGEYTVHVEKSHHQGAPINRAVDPKFSIAAQSVRLDPFADSRIAGLLETQAHSVQPGSSTTYLLMVNNTGAVNDTFTINLSAPNAPSGWGATVAGPDVLARRISVPAHESRVLTVTVNAPFSATGEVIHLVNVTSTLDPGARSRDLTLVTTVRGDLVRDLGIVFLARSTTVEPGVASTFPVYLWNRGTRVANASLEISETPAKDWEIDFTQGTANVDRLVLSSIQPGDIAEATLRVTGPLATTQPTHPITINATLLDVAGVSTDRAITFALEARPGVSLTVLTNVGAHEHIAELSHTVDVTQAGTAAGQQPQAPTSQPTCDVDPSGLFGSACQIDGLDGLWYRVWVSNTGRVTDTFDLTADSFVSNCQTPTPSSPRAPPVFPNATDGLGVGGFGFYFRGPSGGFTGLSRLVDLPAGNTSEVYLWVPVHDEQGPCETTDGSTTETFDFVIQAKGAAGSIARAGISAKARDGLDTNADGSNGVYLEGVARESGYSSTRPYVDISNAAKRTVVASVQPGGKTTYYVRMTHLADWGEYTGTENTPRKHENDLKISLLGVKYDEGWNVSIRPVLDSSVNTLELNPYGNEYNFTNVNLASGTTPAPREGWFDRELEVVVTAPSIANGTAVAGLRHEFQILAETNRTNERSTLGIATIVGNLADVKVTANQTTISAHAGKAAPFLLTVSNEGSSASDVTLRASMADGVTGAWQVNPNAQRFPLAPFKNRTIALLVTPPAGATQGARGDVNVAVEYARDPLQPNKTNTTTLRLTADVVGPSALQLSTSST